MHRRQFLTRTLPLLAVPFLARGFSNRAIDVVGEANVIDMLGLLTLNWTLLRKWHTDPSTFTAVDFQKLRSSGISTFHPAVALGSGDLHDDTRSWFLVWNRLIERHPDYFVRIDAPSDLGRAQKENKIGIILGMQDANHFRKVDDVDAFYKLGQRLTQLTYNSVNRLGSGCMVSADKGLTPFGGDVVARMNAVGMAIDISHCGQCTSLDAIEASKKPVLITHSNCRTLAPNVPRCKADDVIQAAARKGGVIGITSVRHFVKIGDPVTVEHVLDHFDYAVKLVGVEHVGLGSDFDLDPHPAYDVPGLNQPQRIYELTEGLLRRGYGDRDIALMLGGNFQRVLQEIWS